MTDQAGKFAVGLKNFDWVQHLFHRNTPCFYFDGENICGRGEPWDGHGILHDFLPLHSAYEKAVAEAVEKERARCCRIVAGMCESNNEATRILKKIQEGKDLGQ